MRKILALKSNLYKPFERLHSIFNVNVGQGDVDSGCAYIEMPQDAPKCEISNRILNELINLKDLFSD